MKYLITIITFILSIALTGLIHAQSSESLAIPLSNPSAPGHLKLSSHTGSISVSGYNGQDVMIDIIAIDNNEDHEKHTRSGLRRIPNKALDVSISEEDNHIKINSSKGHKNYTIKVPHNFSLALSTHHNGDILIDNVNGELDLNAHHGGITAENISGSVIADTHHGEIKVTFTDINNDTPMAFSTYHGNVDVSFPSGLNAIVKMKSTKGDVYTDFEFEAKRPKLEESKNGSKKEIKMSGWTYGVIGQGGEEFMFDTYHGDIIIRKSN